LVVIQELNTGVLKRMLKFMEYGNSAGEGLAAFLTPNGGYSDTRGLGKPMLVPAK
jgi:hypothetical protein